MVGGRCMQGRDMDNVQTRNALPNCLEVLPRYASSFSPSFHLFLFLPSFLPSSLLFPLALAVWLWSDRAAYAGTMRPHLLSGSAHPGSVHHSMDETPPGRAASYFSFIFIISFSHFGWFIIVLD